MRLLMRLQLLWDRLATRPTIVRSRPGTLAEWGADENGRWTLADGTPMQLLPSPGCRCEFCRRWGDWPR